MKDYKTGREINIKEKVLIVGDKVYSRDSYFSFDTRNLEDYPPKVYYDREDIYLGKMFDKGIFELEDIEDIVQSYSDTCYSNHDLEDIRSFLIKKREKFYKKLENDE